jgi:hypothetical protein
LFNELGNLLEPTAAVFTSVFGFDQGSGRFGAKSLLRSGVFLKSVRFTGAVPFWNLSAPGNAPLLETLHS